MKVIETIAVETMAELREAASRPTPADMVELRLDWIRDLDVAGAMQGWRTPAVVTCRAAWEGGKFRGSEEERLRILERAATLGAEYVDIEWRADRAALDRCRAAAKIVV